MAGLENNLTEISNHDENKQQIIIKGDLENSEHYVYNIKEGDFKFNRPINR